MVAPSASRFGSLSATVPEIAYAARQAPVEKLPGREPQASMNETPRILFRV